VTIHRAPTHPAKVLFPLALGTALSLMGNATLYIVLPTHTAEAGIALGVVGILFSANRAIRLLLNGPMGLAYDRWPRRWLFVCALCIGVVPTILYATMRGFWPLLAARLLWGLAWSGIWIGGTTVILDVTTDQDRGRWVGLYQIGFFLGLALGAFAGGLLTDRLGYHATMWIAATVAALGSLPALFLLPETRAARSHRRSPAVKETPLPWHADRALQTVLLIQAINEFITNGVVAGTIALLVQHLLPATNLALGVATATGALGAMRLLLAMAAAPLAGAVSDRLGKRWPVTLGGLVAGIVSMVLVASSTPMVAFAGIVLGALCGASVRALLATLTGDLVSPAQRGRAIGVLNISGDLGNAAGPVVAYASLAWIGLPGVYLACAGLYALGSAAVLWLCRRTTTIRPG
jgi:DHA1 family multidrug resistance protein-like MFS transporter